jgi:hypothetical protein
MNNIIKRTISFKAALWTTILLSCGVIIFHGLVLLQIIPYENIWAGKLKTAGEMYFYESISIAVNGIFILVVLAKGRIIRVKISPKVINTLLWIFVILFSLNTLGNLTSKSNAETMIATPLTFIFALLCLRIVIDAKKEY